MKISKIRYSDIFLRYSKEDITKIVYLDQNLSQDKKCDIGIIFGGVSMIPYRVNEALRLYKKGYLDKLLVTGGIGIFNIDRDCSEAYKMYSYLLENGVSSHDILFENESKSTMENITNSLALLNDLYNLNNLKLALITSDFHLKRCQGLLENKINFQNELVGYGVKDGIYDIDSWYKNTKSKIMILKEVLSLCYYAKQRKMTDYDIPNLDMGRVRLMNK